MKKEPIFVTEPLLPALAEFLPFLESIWARRWLTNGGHFHQELEIALAAYLKVPYVSLFNNGTIALIIALRALNIKGEVITTPFSFIATAHAIAWANLTPVFADIDAETFNLSVDSAAQYVSSQTGCVLPVHCYGIPCDTDGFSSLVESRHIPLMYDAAHAFGIERDGVSILNWGDLSVLSFHATKVFNTFEGGAIICQSKEQKKLIDNYKNFGIEDEITVSSLGINGKMNEVQAAFGLLQLRHIDDAIKRRNEINARYKEHLGSIGELKIPGRSPNTTSNGGYFPVLVQGADAKDRDTLFAKLRSEGILCRRYFYPLITNFSMYSACKGASPDKLPIANRIANQVICLPVHARMTDDQADHVCEIIIRHLA